MDTLRATTRKAAVAPYKPTATTRPASAATPGATFGDSFTCPVASDAAAARPNVHVITGQTESPRAATSRQATPTAMAPAAITATAISDPTSRRGAASTPTSRQ